MNTTLKNLKRNLYKQALTFKSGTTFIEEKGVNTYVSLWHFFADPTDKAAVEYVVNELDHEIEKLQQKEISRESWPKFLQDDHWKEKTYQRFGVPYHLSNNEEIEQNTPGQVFQLDPLGDTINV